jgi:hypothetical protein
VGAQKETAARLTQTTPGTPPGVVCLMQSFSPSPVFMVGFVSLHALTKEVNPLAPICAARYTDLGSRTAGACAPIENMP